ncbi:MAG: phosphoribosylformylglycinamidine synthase [Treponema sp.]|nr:phosphoribosylformylglycinamidine synthase [Treponema sp.]
MSVYEIYVEKKSDFTQEASDTAADLRLGLQIKTITGLRIVNRYYAEGISADDFNAVRNTVFSEPPVDTVYEKRPSFEGARVFAVEFLPGQFDQRADSCAQCISLATGKKRPVIKSAKIYAVYGDISSEEFIRIKSWLINPVESRETVMEIPATLVQKYPEPKDVATLDDFTTLSDSALEELRMNMNLAMDLPDMQFCQAYFRGEEKHDPTVTELRVLDTYWSDHCRHTTFLTELDEVQIDCEPLRGSYERYLELRRSVGRNDEPVTLMDMATIGAMTLKQRGLLPDLDESEEINACSVKIKVDVNGREQDWLLMFKNETHNHPTEIEPFGGAATCLGGAVRDPLSGRAFVYQAMRITGAADPLQNAAVLPGKLPQRKICRTAAAGYSSYGNQIGLATGYVHEIYHPGYAAKRMEIGAVIGAAPAENVVREKPQPGDVVILLGGRTGRDGIGGATGSSKSHTSSSLESCGVDVQKGNAPEERKLQRLFRDASATRLIKRCNDFGAGGVSVSVGELTEGLVIDLDKVPKKYEGLDGTELAISESQERMSVVVDKKDADAFIDLAGRENLEATIIACVTEGQRLVMNWKGKTIVNLSREFLNSNGAKKKAKVRITEPQIPQPDNSPLNTQRLEKFIGGLGVCSQKGLVDRFDSSIGATTVCAPFGGKYQLTPVQVMTAKIPVLKGETLTCSLMSWGFDPVISKVSPYHGAVFAVVWSLAKIIAAGGSRRKCRLSFQEYFERLRNDPARWGKPAAALLGALDAQLGLETAAIGGKDSMSGSFAVHDGESIDVPPTLVSFAVSITKIDSIVTPEFKRPGSFVYHYKPPFSVYEKCDFVALCEYFDMVENLTAEKKILSAWAIGPGGTAEAVVKMCMGNHTGFSEEKPLAAGNGFGGFIFETLECLKTEAELLGYTTNEYTFKTKNSEIPFEKLQAAWENTLEPVYPYLVKQDGNTETFFHDKGVNTRAKSRYAKPKFLIPVFPGTNSEYDTARAVEKAGGKPEIFVIRNLTPADIAESVMAFEKELRSSQGMVIPGGFSGGDEPDGSGKFITAFMRNPAISDAVMELLQKRSGLVCGICNGFQALIKLGLVPYGEIRDMTEDSPTLTYNSIGRHQSVLVRTRVASNKSPWLSHLKPGETHIVPVSHGEGRFIAREALIRELAANGQIATQYVDFKGRASQDIRFNPNNSSFAIEGITSPDGRVFGRMAHNERFDDGLYRNIPGIGKMDIFSGAVAYFK